MEKFTLLPNPCQLHRLDAGYPLADGKLIRLAGLEAQSLHSSAKRLRDFLQQTKNLTWELAVGFSIPDELVGATLEVNSQIVRQAQGYQILIDPQGIKISGHDPAGVFYGVCTLLQILEQADGWLPGMKINDWPDFPARGVMLDISRNKVPTMDTLLGLVDLLAGWKVNQLQLYMEHTFAYRNHPEVWAQASPLTGGEILALDAYCRERFIELVPNQNSFGHMERWLKHDRYAPLAETHEVFQAPWGPMQGPFSLSPVDPESLELVRSLHDELLPHFTSRMFNAGCDEAIDLGQGRSLALCQERGTGQVYLDYLLEIYREITRRGYTLQYWGDIIIYYPDLIPCLPKDAVAMEWGYEALHPFGPHCKEFQAAGVPFYVCPGTSSWNSLAGRTSNALENLRSAAENGLAYGACGYLTTDWGDNGHWQPLPVSYLGLAAGAAYSWSYYANRELDMAQAVNQHAFKDPTGWMGRVAYDLGEVYRSTGLEIHNSSVLFWALQSPFDELRHHLLTVKVNRQGLEGAINAIRTAIEPLERVELRGDDAALVVREYRLAADLLLHGARRGLYLLDKLEDKLPDTRLRVASLKVELEHLIQEFQDIWLRRNQPGGLQDSLAIFERLLAEYDE